MKTMSKLYELDFELFPDPAQDLRIKTPTPIFSCQISKEYSLQRNLATVKRQSSRLRLILCQKTNRATEMISRSSKIFLNGAIHSVKL